MERACSSSFKADHPYQRAIRRRVALLGRKDRFQRLGTRMMD